MWVCVGVGVRGGVGGCVCVWCGVVWGGVVWTILTLALECVCVRVCAHVCVCVCVRARACVRVPKHTHTPIKKGSMVQHLVQAVSVEQGEVGGP